MLAALVFLHRCIGRKSHALPRDRVPCLHHHHRPGFSRALNNTYTTAHTLIRVNPGLKLLLLSCPGISFHLNGSKLASCYTKLTAGTLVWINHCLITARSYYLLKGIVHHNSGGYRVAAAPVTMTDHRCSCWPCFITLRHANQPGIICRIMNG